MSGETRRPVRGAVHDSDVVVTSALHQLDQAVGVGGGAVSRPGAVAGEGAWPVLAMRHVVEWNDTETISGDVFVHSSRGG